LVDDVETAMGHVNDAKSDCGVKLEEVEGFNPIKCVGDVKNLIDDVNTIIAHV